MASFVLISLSHCGGLDKFIYVPVGIFAAKFEPHEALNTSRFHHNYCYYGDVSDLWGRLINGMSAMELNDIHIYDRDAIRPPMHIVQVYVADDCFGKTDDHQAIIATMYGDNYHPNPN